MPNHDRVTASWHAERGSSGRDAGFLTLATIVLTVTDARRTTRVLDPLKATAAVRGLPVVEFDSELASWLDTSGPAMPTRLAVDVATPIAPQDGARQTGLAAVCIIREDRFASHSSPRTERTLYIELETAIPDRRPLDRLVVEESQGEQESQRPAATDRQRLGTQRVPHAPELSLVTLVPTQVSQLAWLQHQNLVEHLADHLLADVITRKNQRSQAGTRTIQQREDILATDLQASFIHTIIQTKTKRQHKKRRVPDGTAPMDMAPHGSLDSGNHRHTASLVVSHEYRPTTASESRQLCAMHD